MRTLHSVYAILVNEFMNNLVLSALRDSYGLAVSQKPSEDVFCECALPPPITAREEQEDFYDVGKAVVDFLSNCNYHAHISMTCFQRADSYPYLIILTPPGTAINARQILRESGANFGFPAAFTDCPMHLMRDNRTGQEGILFRTPLRNVLDFATQLHKAAPAHAI